MSLIASTTNRDGLSVECAMDRRECLKDVRVPDDELASLALERDV